MRLVRLDERQMALQFTLRNNTGDSLIPAADIDQGGMLLVDPPGATVYGVLERGSEYRVSGLRSSLADGADATVTSVYSAPPPDVDRLLVLVDELLPTWVPVEPAGAKLKPDPVLTGQGPATPNVAAMALPVEAAKPGSPQTLEIALPGDVLFAFGSAKLGPRSGDALDVLADKLSGRSGTLLIEGHTDSKGDDASNLRLSRQRADAVREALETKLGSGFTYRANGFGEERPVAPNTRPGGADNPQGRARNRRVTVRLLTRGAAAGSVKPRSLSTRYADQGIEVESSLERVGGAMLLKLKVSAQNQVQLLPGDGLIGNNDAPEGATIVDEAGNRRYLIGAWGKVSGREFTAGTFSSRFGAGPHVLPADAEATLFGLYAEPPPGVKELTVEVGGFGKVEDVSIDRAED